MDDVDIEDIEVLSERQQLLRNIKIKSINIKEKDLAIQPEMVAENQDIEYMAQEIEEQLESLNPYK